jgi:hypothetical protein
VPDDARQHEPMPVCAAGKENTATDVSIVSILRDALRSTDLYDPARDFLNHRSFVKVAFISFYQFIVYSPRCY